jgi:hypothetical protein
MGHGDVPDEPIGVPPLLPVHRARGRPEGWRAWPTFVGAARNHRPRRRGSRHWFGERAATDILVLARKGRAFRSLDTLKARQGGQHVLYGSSVVLAAATQAGAAATGTPVADLARSIVR